MARRQREGWQSGGVTTQATTETTIVTTLENSLTTLNAVAPQDKRGKQIKTRASWTPERAADILQKLKKGTKLEIVARAVGISPSSFQDWRNWDADFGALVIQARFGHIGEMQAIIPDAARRGDWRAAQSVLEHAPETRADYQSQVPGAITFNIKVVRASQAEAEMIDVTPEKADSPIIEATPE